MKNFYKGPHFKKWEIISAVALFIFSVGFFSLQTYAKKLPLRVSAATPKACETSMPPTGALASEPASIWCYTDLNSAGKTAIQGTNSFVDTFTKSTNFSDCCGGYAVFNAIKPTGKAKMWRQGNYWITDSIANISLLRPNNTFSFEGGKLVIEAAVAASMPGYNNLIFPEIIVSTASHPSSPHKNARYGYEQFAQHTTFGCRLEGSTQRVVCTLTDKSTPASAPAKIIYEKKSTTPTASQKAAWKVCTSGQPASACMNTYRLEISATSAVIYVNAIKYAEFSGLALPADLVKGKGYVYFSTTNLDSSNAAYRLQWGALAINPKDSTGKVLSATSISRAPTPVAKASASPSPKPTPQNMSLQLDGKSYARISHASYYNAPKSWTVETWFKDESKEGYDHATRYIITKGETYATKNIPFLIGIEQNNIFVGTRNEGIHKVMTYNLAEHAVSPNVWHHIAVTFDNDSKEMIMYLDSLPTLKAYVSTYTTKENMRPVFIGKNGDRDFWIGKIDDLRIWDKARTAEQIRNAYLSPLTAPQDNLIGNWQFDEGSGDMAYDLSSKKENMTIIKATWSADVPYMR